MNISRGYGGQATLDDGSALTLGGSWSGGSLGKNGELFANGAWRYLPNAVAGVTIGADPLGAATADRYPWLFSVGAGKVAHVGPSAAMNLFDTASPEGGTQAAGNRGDDGFSQHGTATMFDIGRILKAGGAGAYDGAAANSNSYVIDVSGNGIAAVKTGPLRLARGMHNAVALPNGEVLVTGGMPVPRTFNDADSIYVSEIWSPATGSWRDAAPTSVPRNYHSIALLLPDGRVLSGGGGLCGQGCAANHPDVQIYSPPYLFKADGSPAPRPAITQAPAAARHSTSVNVTATGGAAQFVLIRLASTTHSYNTDQRRVPLAATPQGNGYFTLAIPNSGVAPPGNYMLFALDSSGVPSVARIFQVQSPPRPTVSVASPGAGANYLSPASIAINAAVNDPGGIASRVDFFNGSTLLGQDASAPYSFTWTNVPAGSYTLRAVVVDNTGFSASATASITVSATQTYAGTSSIGAAIAPFDGAAFDLRCQANEVMAGFAGKSWTYVNSTGPLCVAVNAAGQWQGSPTARGRAGGTGGVDYAKTCPANQAVVGFQGRGGWGVDQIDLACQPLSANGAVSGAVTFLGPAGGSGASPYSPAYCPAPIPAAAIRGSAGSSVGTFGLSCSLPLIGGANLSPVVSLSSPANGAVYSAPAAIAIAANASDPENSLAKVEFFNGSAKLGERTSAPYAFTWTGVPAGAYAITAKATDAGGLTASVAVTVTVNGSAGAPARVLQSMKGAPVPQPAAINSFVANRAAAIALGKALFWDTQVSSDGRVACASCHFQAGADVRFKNQSNPGMARVGVGPFSFAPTKGGAAASGPNYKMTAADFPTYVLSDPLNANSAATFQTTDVVGSQGVTRRAFNSAASGQAADTCADGSDPVFGGFRQVSPRNAPTVINAAFNHRNFHDGRANNVFNGVDSFGDRNSGAVVYRGPSAAPTRISLENSSLASQAMTPPLSAGEMSCAGRTWPDIGRRLLKAKPLARQSVASTDGVLAPYVVGGSKGLNVDYEALVKSAFANDLWNSAAQVSVNGRAFTQAEANFSLFFGLAVQLYESTLVSDDAPIDRYFGAYPGTAPVNAAALTAEQIQGLALFTGKGNCVSCHSGPQLTNAGTPAFQALQSGVIADRMLQGNGAAGLYDFGFYNIGLRTTSADIGLGGADPFGNPLSFARQEIGNARKDGFALAPCAFSAQACAPVDAATRAVVDGAFKTPTLRNAALTGPYFHDGSRATLEDVVDFYIRAGDARGNGTSDSTGFGLNPSNLAAGLARLEFSAAERQALLAFLKGALTDDRVAYERAPFDHPELALVDGQTDVVVIPAVGQGGRSTPLAPFANLVAAGTLGYPGAVNAAPSAATPGTQNTALNSAASLQIAASDPDGDALTYTAGGLPNGLSINAATGLISGIATSAGNFGPFVIVRDSANNSATISFYWNVAATAAPPVTVSLTSPANNATFAISAPITLAASAAQAGGSIARVEFYDGATLLGTATAAPYQYLWTSAAAGAHSLSAKAYGSASAAAAVSAGVSITVSGGSCAFPSVAVTDNFNRGNGALGGAWTGATTGFSIAGNQAVSAGGDSFIVSPGQLGVNVEASLKVTNLASGLSEVDLVLKAAGTKWWEDSLIVAYLPAYRVIQVWTFDNAAYWVMRGEIRQTLANGDVLGARLRGASGAVEVYRNGALVGGASVAGWSRQNTPGAAGAWVVGGAGTALDDFRSGPLTCQ